ncbi:uncharacterized protein LOC120275199 [Dioscorea cayenensis subsp. rotundata]|uniref:Uncharacterized protein LOC120275199 n=1 Tax=Dioscorea cayennensis subsp. rotundata TaxID=55577 RepID=A0AB40CDJ6_DIOCR|nr:uncharacterized protein LOC120275199 [Dioscorea cayenensis subsp. rotundata]
MARQGHLETLVPEERIQGEAMDDDADSGEEREVQELEREIKDLAQRILDSRRSMPDRLSQALASRLLALRPSLPSITIPEMVGQSQLSEPLAGADQEMLQKLHSFSDKTSQNVSAMPALLKRMNDCIARIDKLDEYNVNIHSVFKQK